MRALKSNEVTFVTGGGSEDDKQGGYGGFDFDYSNEGRGRERGFLDDMLDFLGDMYKAWICSDGDKTDRECVREQGGYSFDKQK